MIIWSCVNISSSSTHFPVHCRKRDRLLFLIPFFDSKRHNIEEQKYLKKGFAIFDYKMGVDSHKKTHCSPFLPFYPKSQPKACTKTNAHLFCIIRSQYCSKVLKKFILSWKKFPKKSSTFRRTAGFGSTNVREGAP